MAEREQALRDAVLFLLRGVARAEEVSELRAGHAALELGLAKTRRDELVLFEQHVLGEADVRDADRLLVAQSTVVAEDRDLGERVLLRVVQRAVAVVVADGVGRRDVREPARVQQRVQPRVVLPETVTGPATDIVIGRPLPTAVEQDPDAPQVRAAPPKEGRLCSKSWSRPSTSVTGRFLSSPPPFAELAPGPKQRAF